MAETYNLYRDGELVAEEIAETEYTDTGLTPNTMYEYEVTRVTDVGESDKSNKVAVTTDYSDVASVSLSDSALALEIGETQSLTATVTPDTALQDIEWESGDGSIATVTDGGLVEAVAEGETVITVSSLDNPEKTATCTVTVAAEAIPDPPEGLSSVGNTDTEVDLDWQDK